MVKGYNTTIFAYGQTGSGKTYTMFGPHWDDYTHSGIHYQNTLMNLEDRDRNGLIPRSIEEIFSQLDSQGEDERFTVYCSFLQIYNEKLFDLF